MRELTSKDRSLVDEYLDTMPYKTFYHYFPYLLSNGALIEETEPDPIYAFKDILYLSSGATNKEVVVAPYPQPNRSKLYDNNYIYDLQSTLSIKNLRNNVKKFERDNDFFVRRAKRYDVVQVILDWYNKKKTPDYEYVMWFVNHSNFYNDLHSEVGYIDGKPVAFSVWGELSRDTSVHIISKDKGIPYLQDKMRTHVYQSMVEDGFTLCNDGGDTENHSLRMYKLKLRPKWILPIWSWKDGI